MEKRDFVMLENMCQLRFKEAGSCFHVCTQENLPVVFHGNQEFRAAMNSVAFAAFTFPEVTLFTFEIMINHLHLVLAGLENKVEEFSNALLKKLAYHPELKNSRGDILQMEAKRHPVNSLDNLRNVIAYTNKNGAVVSPDENVYTYKWGANRYFYNREAKNRYLENGHPASQEEKRKLFRSHRLDKVNNVIVLDDYISPLCYCAIQKAEEFFSSNRQYFFKVSKGVETHKEIATIIGESIFYTDYDLIDVIASACRRDYGVRTSSELKPEAKLEIAKFLHYEYNAGNKQISRLMKIPVDTLSALFSR